MNLAVLLIKASVATIPSVYTFSLAFPHPSFSTGHMKCLHTKPNVKQIIYLNNEIQKVLLT